MTTVNELIKALHNFSWAKPGNGSAQVMIRNTDGVCFEFGEATHATGNPTQNFLVMVPNEKGLRFKIKELKVLE